MSGPILNRKGKDKMKHENQHAFSKLYRHHILGLQHKGIFLMNTHGTYIGMPSLNSKIPENVHDIKTQSCVKYIMIKLL